MLGNQESQDSKFQLESKGLRTRSSDIQGQEKMDVPGPAEIKSILPLPFSYTGRPHFIASPIYCASQRLCFPWFHWFQNIEGKTFHQQKNYGSLYCNTHFIVGVWNQTHHIFQASLYNNHPLSVRGTFYTPQQL